MSEFKKMIEEDLDTFFNLDEFGETHLIDSLPVTCIITDKDIQSNSSDTYGSTFIETKKVTMKTTDYQALSNYSKDDEIYIDDKRYIVVSVSDKLEITEIKVEGNRS